MRRLARASSERLDGKGVRRRRVGKWAEGNPLLWGYKMLAAAADWCCFAVLSYFCRQIQYHH
ncbi:MAG: hypothetical protein U0264_13240 [Candidatus Kapaibacterium sp.]